MKKLRTICMIVFICLIFMVPVHAENMDGGDPLPGPDAEDLYDEMYPMCKKDDYDCISDNVENAPAATPEDFQQAIRSFDPDVAAQETDQFYLKFFTNSSLTASTSTLNFDLGYTIVLMITNFIVTIFEVIGSVFSLIALAIYNMVSGSTIEGIIGSVFDMISEHIFDWSNMRSWVYNLLFLLAGISITQKMLALIKRQMGAYSNRQMIGIIFETVLSVSMIVFIGMYGRPTIHYIEELAENSIASTFRFSETENMEIQTKSDIFELMQMKPFMMRHFGTTDIERLPVDPEKVEGDLLEFNQKRVDMLIANPSTSQAKYEKSIGNTAILQGYGTAAMCILNSFLGLIHKIIAGIVIIALCFGVGCIRLMKEFLLFFSVIGLMFMLTRRNPKTYQWFFNRISWTLISIIATILFDVILYSWCAAVDAIVSFGFLFVLLFDALLIVCCILAWKNREYLLEKMSAGMKEMSGTVSGIFNGSLSPQEVYSKFTDSINREKGTTSSDKADTSNEKEGDSSSSKGFFDLFSKNKDLADEETNMEVQDKGFDDLSDEADGRLEDISEKLEEKEDTVSDGIGEGELSEDVGSDLDVSGKVAPDKTLYDTEDFSKADNTEDNVEGLDSYVEDSFVNNDSDELTNNESDDKKLTHNKSSSDLSETDLDDIEEMDLSDYD